MALGCLTRHGEDHFKATMLGHLDEFIPVSGPLCLLHNNIRELTAEETHMRHWHLSKQALKLTDVIWANTALAVCSRRFQTPEWSALVATSTNPNTGHLCQGISDAN